MKKMLFSGSFKNVKTIIMVLSMAVFVVSCASSPYSVSNTMDIGQLQGTVAFSEIAILPMSYAFIPLIDAGIYNSFLDSNESKRNAVVTRAATKLVKHTSLDFSEDFSVKTVLVDAKFDTLYDKNNNVLPYVEQQIAKLCEDNNADYMVVLQGRIETTGVSFLGITGKNQFFIGANIFDKNGKKICSGTVDGNSDTINASSNEDFGIIVEMSKSKVAGLLRAMIVAPKRN
ncbi:MAG: hypothetical protein LBV52_05345 [Spirochaetaceae bacterium]|jgi:hypothetical protein|nr:hypothetical protein [Spirochaetaceae bacterium]